MADFLDVTRRQIAERLKELEPLANEYHRLTAAASALEDAVGAAASTVADVAGSAAGSVRASVTGSPTTTATRKRRRTGRRKGSGKRAAQALSFVKAQPGITIPELAAKMGIKQNYLYRILPPLEKQGKLSKQRKGWYPK